MYTCICIYVCIYIYICVYTCIYIYVCIYICIYVCMYIYIYICICLNIYICIHVYVQSSGKMGMWTPSVLGQHGYPTFDKLAHIASIDGFDPTFDSRVPSPNTKFDPEKVAHDWGKVVFRPHSDDMWSCCSRPRLWCHAIPAEVPLFICLWRLRMWQTQSSRWFLMCASTESIPKRDLLFHM